MLHKPKKLYVIILAGGGGTRLWPVSRKRAPKHVLKFIGKKTLLQTTFARIRKVVPVSRIFIVTNIAHAKIIRTQLPGFPRNQLLCEPEKKDTASAVGFAAAVIAAKDPHAIVATAWSDGFIPNETRYKALLYVAAHAVERYPHHTLLLGVRPTYPETGYGYIQMGKKAVALDGESVFHVAHFYEKPDLKTAKKYVARWNFLWNPGMFVWNVSTLLGLYKRHLPKHYALLFRIHRAYGKPQFDSVVAACFKKFVPISIDYGIIEKAKEMLVVPGDFRWADVGHWRSVKEVIAPIHIDNLVKGKHIGIDTAGSLLYGYTKRLIATVGIKDLIVVDTPDVLLICPKDRAQDVKKIVDQLKKQKLERYV